MKLTEHLKSLLVLQEIHGSVEILFPLDEEGVAHTDQDTFDVY